MPINDNDLTARAPARVPDAHGHAALLLVESLIHGLRERSILNRDEAIEVVETAIDVQADIADAADGAGATMRQAQALLLAIAESLRRDDIGQDGDGQDGDGRGGKGHDGDGLDGDGYDGAR